MGQPIQIRVWLAGLGCLVPLLVLVALLQMNSVFGLDAHQTATTAAQTSEIQHTWADEGNLTLAWLVMLADLLFISVYGVGSILAGRGIYRIGGRAMLVFGVLAMLGGLSFLLIDYCETILQVVQLAKGEGDQALVDVVSSLMNAKLLAFAASFWGVVLALVLLRLRKQAE